MIGEAEEAGPENSLEGGFPAAPVAGYKCRGICAKKEGGFRELRSDAGDPKRGVAVAGETEDGIEISAVNEVPEAGIEEAEEGFYAGAAIADVGPGVTVEERNVPLNAGAKFGIVTGFGAAKSAIGDLEIEGRVGGHAAEDRGHVLNGMGRDGKDAVARVRHAILPGFRHASWQAEPRDE